jgi:hypothetical protein
MKTLSDQLAEFFLSLQPPALLPAGVEVLFPFKEPVVIGLVKKFFTRFYNDNKQRRLILGINPGRFGAGTTGINFTAPRQLKNYCGIEHTLKDQSELSAEFIYEMIEQYGGPDKFYGDYFISAVSPLGFVKNGVNMNYYDDRELSKALIPFIITCLQKLIGMGFKTDKCFCIGGDKNFNFLSKLNEEHKFFNQIVPLPHPRFIMQYRRKQKEKYIEEYLEALGSGGPSTSSGR